MRFVVILVVITGLVYASTWGVMRSHGHFREVVRNFDGRCTPVTGIAGPEDLYIDDRRRIVFISSLDRRKRAERGGIHVFNLDDPLSAEAWRDMTAGAPSVFRPLGLDYYEDDERRRLFVVNDATNAVELFDVHDGRLIYLKSYSDPRLTSPADVAAIGPDSFYVANATQSARRSFLGRIDFLTRARTGAVYLFDNQDWRVAADRLRYAGGIVVNPNGDTVYVSETAGRAVQAFSRDPQTNDLAARAVINLPAAPDNLTIDREGSLWIAAQPRPLAVPLQRISEDLRLPSMVFKSAADSADTVYADDGKEISAASVAARIDQTLMIGALFENKFLICDLPNSEV